MNERIKELHEQAHSYACEYARRPDYNPHNPYNEGMYKERYVSKFAELIVREMLDITDAHTEVFQTDRDKALIEHIKQSVKQHFGVKE